MGSQPKWKDDARQALRDKARGNRFKLKEGENTIRILPDPTDLEEGQPYYENMVHSNVGPDKKLVTCGKDMQGHGKCWLCDKIIPSLAESHDESKLTRAKALAPRNNFMVQVAILDEHTEKMVGPMIWYVPTGKTTKALDNRILSLLSSSKRRYEDPHKGYNINIQRTGTGFTDTRYGAPEPDEEPTPISKSIIKKLKPLEDLVRHYSRTEQEAAYYGREIEKGEEHMAVKGKPVAKKKAKKKVAGSDSGSGSASASASASGSGSGSGSASDSGTASSSEETKPKKGAKKPKASSDSGSGSGSASASGSGSASASGSDSDSGSASSSEEKKPKKGAKKPKASSDSGSASASDSASASASASGSESASESEEDKPKKKATKKVAKKK